MKILFIVFTLALSANNCHKSKIASIPPCIQARIDEIKKDKPWNPAAEVHEYTYQGKRVFYFNSRCCDFYNTVYDENCNYVCAPDGGITGTGDRKCPDFRTSAKEVRLVWKDERKP